jgi:hypothetical protein
MADLGVGDLVYSIDRGAIRAVPIVRVARRAIDRHVVVSVVTEDGLTLQMSGRHPTADGRTFDGLAPGERLDGHVIRSIAVVPYAYDATYDILPRSETGTYFAGGMAVGSTLGR